MCHVCCGYALLEIQREKLKNKWQDGCFPTYSGFELYSIASESAHKYVFRPVHYMGRTQWVYACLISERPPQMQVRFLRQALLRRLKQPPIYDNCLR